MDENNEGIKKYKWVVLKIEASKLKCSIGNVVSNIVITVCGVRQAQD